MTYYGTRFGCRFGKPHEPARIKETPYGIWEKCEICNQKFHWKKGPKGRLDNAKYLKVHVKSFAQKFGPTKRVYMKAYEPDKTIITI